MLAARGTKVNRKGQNRRDARKISRGLSARAVAARPLQEREATRMSKTAAKIKIENVLQPGKTYSADAAKYEAMKKAVLAVLPKASPGLTVAEVQDRVVPHLPESLFPGGAKSGWWMKAVQLDLEAKGIVRRTNTSPLRLHRA